MIALTQKISNADYHSLPSISSTKLKDFRRSKYKYYQRYIAKTLPFRQTKATLLGSMIHALTLEPETFSECYVVAPECDRRTKIGKAIWNEFVLSAPDEAEVVDAELYARAKAASDALLTHPKASAWLGQTGPVEQPVYWEDPETGLACRAKLDKLAVNIDVILDIKSCIDATPNGLANAIVNFEYDRQAAWYREGFHEVHGVWPDFVFLAVETSPPYEVGFYDLDSDDLAEARITNRMTLNTINQCMKTNDWIADHQNEVTRIKLPKRARYREQYQTYFEESQESEMVY